MVIRGLSRGVRSREGERDGESASRSRLDRPGRAPRPREGAIAGARARVREDAARRGTARERDARGTGADAIERAGEE